MGINQIIKIAKGNSIKKSIKYKKIQIKRDS